MSRPRALHHLHSAHFAFLRFVVDILIEQKVYGIPLRFGYYSEKNGSTRFLFKAYSQEK